MDCQKPSANSQKLRRLRIFLSVNCQVEMFSLRFRVIINERLCCHRALTFKNGKVQQNFKTLLLSFVLQKPNI